MRRRTVQSEIKLLGVYCSILIYYCTVHVFYIDAVENGYVQSEMYDGVLR